MKIEKVLNNNVVVALDENGAETVLMGRGLGFGRRAGDEAPPDKVEKRFTLHSDQLSDRFQQLMTSIPLPHFLMSERIINHAKIALGKELSDSIYVTLPDHISAAVNRYKEGIVLPNPLLWDIRQLYKDEFRVGLKANEIVKEETGVEFTDDEAAFIALHFVNAQLGGEIRDIYDMTYLLQAVFRIVYDEYGFRPDDESLNYYRFVTHLKFYARRIVSGEGYGDEDSDLLDVVRFKYPKAYACADKIRVYVQREKNFHSGQNELLPVFAMKKSAYQSGTMSMSSRMMFMSLSARAQKVTSSTCVVGPSPEYGSYTGFFTFLKSTNTLLFGSYVASS